MLFTQLFESDDKNQKKVIEGLADEFMAMARAKGMNPRLRGTPDEERARTDAMLKQRAADRAAAPAPAPVGDEERARLQARLKELEAKFDPNYQYIDAPSGGEWSKQDAIAKQIGAIKQKLSQGMSEARAATAAFRAGNKKRAELNAMSDEERRAYDKEQQEKQRRRDDARLERERQKNAQKKGVAEDVRLPYPVRSEKLGRANMALLVRAYNEPKSARIALSFGDRIIELDRDDVEAIAHYYDDILKDDNARWNFVKGIMSDPDGLTNVLIKIGRRTPGAARQPGLFQEADKKKDDAESEVKDVALQRAISRAKADFPTAGTGIEALAKDFMRSQEQDQQAFDQIRQAERKQDSLLNQINKIDQEQEQEINDLENQNSGLARRLQQLQNVNSELEKKLAAMSGRRSEKTSSAEPMPTSSKAEPAVVAPKSKPAKGKKVKTKAPAPKPTAKSQPRLSAPPAPSAMSQVAKQLTTQNPEVLEPDFTDTVSDELPRFRKIDTTKAVDVPYRTPTRAELPGDVAQNVNAYADAMVGDKLRQTVDQELAKTEGKQKKSEPPEVDYDDPRWDAMVKRVGQLAKQGPRKTVWDPVKRVYKTVPVNPVKEQEPGNRAGYNAIKSVSDWADKLRTMQELQRDIKLMADPEAKAAVQQRMGELLKLGIERGYTK